MRTRFDNIGLERAYGVNFFGNVKIGKNFSLNGGSDLFYSVLDNNLDGSARIQTKAGLSMEEFLEVITLKTDGDFSSSLSTVVVRFCCKVFRVDLVPIA